MMKKMKIKMNQRKKKKNKINNKKKDIKMISDLFKS